MLEAPEGFEINLERMFYSDFTDPVTACLSLRLHMIFLVTQPQPAMPKQLLTILATKVIDEGVLG